MEIIMYETVAGNPDVVKIQSCEAIRSNLIYLPRSQTLCATESKVKNPTFALSYQRDN